MVACAAVIQAKVVKALFAVLADAAAAVRFARDAVAGLQRTDALADLDDLRGKFVTGGEGIVGRPPVLQHLAVKNAGIGAADRNGLDLDEHLAASGLRNGDGLDGKFTGSVDHDRAHLIVHRTGSPFRFFRRACGGRGGLCDIVVF